MATSGVTTTELSRDSIIAGAMRKCAALAKGQSPDAEDLLNNTEALNNLVAEFMTLGMPLWAKRTYTVPMVADQNEYTLTAPFPLKIIQAWVTAGSSRQDLVETADYDINMLPEDSSGVPSQYSYQPQINQGTLTLWPTPDATTVADYSLSIRYFAPFDTFVSAGDTPFFPREWNNALVYGLAVLLAPEYGVPIQDRGMLEKQADKHLSIALDAGNEQASIFLQPS